MESRKSSEILLIVLCLIDMVHLDYYKSIEPSNKTGNTDDYELLSCLRTYRKNDDRNVLHSEPKAFIHSTDNLSLFFHLDFIFNFQNS